MNKTDLELLEAAAKAVGYSVARLSDDDSALCLVGVQQAWNPLTDDGDALRLAVTLRLEIDIHHTGVAVRTTNGLKVLVWAAGEPSAHAATRRAIVRAAAAMMEKT
jgi:hypothetical protein